jgi:transcriptional antiterminator
MRREGSCRESRELGATRSQREIVRDVMLLAAFHDVWMSLDELANKTRYPQASISAQLRHLRKRQYGGFVVEKRRRTWEEAKKASVREMVWEYQMRRGMWFAEAGNSTAGGAAN